MHTIRTITFIIALSFLPICASSAQTIDQKKISEGIYFFNKFQDEINKTHPNIDSALFCLRKLSYLDITSLRYLLHNSFAQAFILWDPQDSIARGVGHFNKSIYKELLSRMIADTTHTLRTMATPIYLLSRIQDENISGKELKELTNDFIKEELSANQFYKDKTGRYGLMIYQIISKYPQLQKLSQKLIKEIKSHLDINYINTMNSSSKIQADERAWYRYIYASVNYIESKQCKKINDMESFLKVASFYSPDLIDENNRDAYFYEMFFIFGKPKETFKDDYLAFLTKSYTQSDKIKNDYLTFLTKSYTDTRKALTILLQMALNDPSYKDVLREYYDKHSFTNLKFHDFWINAIDSSASISPSIEVHQIDNDIFSSSTHKGEWIFIDFWGTWCQPCRKELPDLQKYYESILSKRIKGICLITIACKDTISNVIRYMKENSYSFPVAMSDGKIEKQYSVPGYPTKILITPNRKYITIPFGTDWIKFIAQYRDDKEDNFAH